MAALAIFGSASMANAYCRTSSCPGVGTSQVCNPPAEGDCGVPLFWPKTCVGWSLQKNASSQVSFPEMEQIVTKAFETWMNAPCEGGGHPRIVVQQAEPAECAKHEYNQTAGNANIILFHDDSWPYEGSSNTLALTTVTYNLDTGEIYDADMEINSADITFTTGDSNVVFDLPSVVTHETGHFLGLAHSHDVHATMFPDYIEHTTNLRNLSPDDIAGICAIYPPGQLADDCDITPRHGFSPLCAAEQAAEKGCSTAAAGCDVAGGASGRWAGAAALCALLLAARRRRSRG
jgi:hypothetical protein